MISRIGRVLTGVATSGALVFACTPTVGDDVVLGVAKPPAFVDPDAGASAPDASDVRSYCPSDRCPSGHTTCPNSTFLCDVDLLTDPLNCGECGNVCPKSGTIETYTCVEGRCKMNCVQGYGLDCDGVPDNGCEVTLPNNDHCGVCGLKCPADAPCIDRFELDYGCGCKPGELFCPGPFGLFAPCVDPQYDDENCGACNNACPPEGDGSELPANTYSGCFEGACGALKCKEAYGDCDHIPGNGCEAPLATNENCGRCGNRCPDGTQCRLNNALMPECMCPEGVTFCKTGTMSQGETVLEIGYCADLSSRVENCGACGHSCAGGAYNAYEVCVYGKCERSCSAGWGDCNGNLLDGCETDINADPKNCGACGKVCDGIAGQACVDGRCMVEPCEVLQDGGGPTR